MAECIINTLGKVVTSYGSEKIPTIIIWIDSQWENSSFLREILSGIEEEKVPACYTLKDGRTLELSYGAANESRLGVGIGIGFDKKVALHHYRLPKEKPMFQFILSSMNKVSLRMLGSNSARLVKGIPLKMED